MLALALSLLAENDTASAVRGALSAMRAKPYDRSDDKTGLLRPSQYYRTPLALTEAVTAARKAGWAPIKKLDGKPSENVFRFRDREMTLSTWGVGNENVSMATVTRIPAKMRTLSDQRAQLMYWDLSDDSFTTLIGEGATNTVLFPAGKSDRLLFIASNWFEWPDGKPFEMGIACYGYENGKAKRLWMTELVPDRSAPSKGSLDRYLRGLEVWLDSEQRRGWRMASVPPEANRDLLAHTGWVASSESSGDGGVAVGFIEADGSARWAHRLDEIEITLAEEAFLKR